MKTVAILQARMASSRLPGKILADIEGKPMLQRVWDRAVQIDGLDGAVVATTTLSSDDPVETFCQARGIPCFRGSVDDVLDRFYQAALQLKADIILRLTADCPLLDPVVSSRVLRELGTSSCDYSSNALQPTFPDGLDSEAFSFAVLETAWKEADKKSEREHVTPFIYNHPKRFRLHRVLNETDLSSHRWTVDENRDLEFIRSVYRHFGEKDFGCTDVLTLLEKKPDLADLNQGISRNEGYTQSLRND
jgi:spore coat polysaccharide biosynthesis protein SpsF (cytidylyltransferase family)